MTQRRLAAMLLPLLLTACGAQGPGGGGNGGDGAVAAIRLTPAAATVQVGQTQRFSATAEDSSGSEVRSVSFAWSSSNPAVATVAGGVATGVSAGEAEITASAQGVTSGAAVLTVTAQGGGGGAAPLHDTIAYVRGDGDEIRLIDPDGSNDRALWTHGLDDPNGVYAVWNMSWKPDATELAFASTHENWCSLFHSDIYAVAADGSDYRRVTQAPACADLANYPTGTVRVPVRNDSFDSFSGFLYFQGAPSVQPVNLPPGGIGVVTFEGVADFGAGEEHLQVATVIVGDYREILFSTMADVEAGGTVTTAETGVFPPSISWEARSPSWRAGGSGLGHVLNFNSLWQIDPDPTPLAFGSAILAEDAETPDFVDHLAWGPTPATAAELLFAGNVVFDSEGIYRASAGAGEVGAPLVAFDSTENVMGLAWLPDGSGFVYSVTEGDYFGEDRSSNLFVYDFAAGESTRITAFVGAFAGQVSVSPDGQRFVFEHAAELNDFQSALLEPDLWLVNRDGSDPRLLVADAYAPAWSR